jgi:hypothetical protein
MLVIRALARAFRADLFVETGTYHGATAICAQRQLSIPVYSCELSLKKALVSKLLTLRAHGISVSWDCSVKFLRRLVPRLRHRRPMFYLDAHGGDERPGIPPLREELLMISELDNFVAVIDDFRVPGQESFGYDTYAGTELNLDFVRMSLLQGGIKRMYFPGYSADLEGGRRRGYAVFWRSDDLDVIYTSPAPAFPLNLLVPHEL